ncbi:hypothetical protein L0244_12090, partial [bacterium]|nr:hypothetical protein [bacterium]
TNLWIDYIFLGDIPAVQVTVGGIFNVRQYITTNPVGMPNRLSDQTGAISWQTEEFPFGDLYSQSMITANILLRFPGQYDEGNNTYQNVWRFYFPKIGRYSQSDPLLDRARYYNRGIENSTQDQLVLSSAGFTHIDYYAYALNNPVKFVDLKGEVVIIGCKASDEAAINQAITDLRKKLKEKPCCAGSKGPRILSDLGASDFTVECKADLEGCGYAPFNSVRGKQRLIQIGPSAPKCCGGLPSTILHEVWHIGGGTESQSYYLEEACYGCPVPEKYRKKK